MEPLLLKEIAAALGNELESDAVVTNICIDTREVGEGSLFVAIKGERFDGHDFIPKAFELGAVGVISHKALEAAGPVILVENTREAFLKLGGWYRRRFDVKTVSVTGSVGKTSTKEMIDTVLSSKFKTLKTEGNLNNEIGLPKTLFRLDSSYSAAVIEMGMSGFHEIDRLSKAACGDFGVITNIGVSHIEKLGSREGILKAKLEILDGLKEDAPLAVNADNDLLSDLSLEGRRLIRYGINDPSAEIRAEAIVPTGISETSFTVVYKGNRYPASVPVLGEHHVLNALAAFAAGIEFGMTPEEIVSAFPNYRSSGMRQKTVDFGGIIVVEDCYNASPDSMQASLAALSLFEKKGKSVAVLGDMLELGDYSETAHRQVGGMAAENRLDAVLCYGEHSNLYLADEAEKRGVPCVVRCGEKEDAVRWLKENLVPGDVVWFKASRGMKLEEIIKAFYGEE